MATTRTFVAIPVPAALGVKLTRLQALLAPDAPGVRWSDDATFHLTLAFLGDVEDPDLNHVCHAVARASAKVGPLNLRIEGLGVFPDPQKARVLWVGVIGDDLPGLVRLQAAVAAELDGSGYPLADSRFHPHVTLGRIKHGRGRTPDLPPLLSHYRTWAAGSFQATEVITYSSTTTSDGPVYAPLARAELSGGKVGPSA